LLVTKTMHWLVRLATVLALCSITACAEYQGEQFDPVVTAREVEEVDELPPGYTIIGVVSADTEHDASTLIGELWCQSERRLRRRMRREAAAAGGELLVDVECSYEEEEVQLVEYDEYGNETVVDELNCWRECVADVARQTGT